MYAKIMCEEDSLPGNPIISNTIAQLHVELYYNSITKTHHKEIKASRYRVNNFSPQHSNKQKIFFKYLLNQLQIATCRFMYCPFDILSTLSSKYQLFET